MSDEQRPDILMLGTRDYPALRIKEEADPQHPESFSEADAIDFEYFVYLTAFQETFNARWQEGERSYGRLNPMYYYGGTDREASISFTLPAMTVQESEQNLRKCSELSRSVYGRYRTWSIDDVVQDFTMIGHRYFRVDFGNLIMNERVFVSAFSFTINPEAGVFEHDKNYYTAEAAASRRGTVNPVQTGNTGNLLPRQIDVEISLIFKHDYPLGFGGPNGDPEKWAGREDGDFPHGRGELSSTAITSAALRRESTRDAELQIALEDFEFATRTFEPDGDDWNRSEEIYRDRRERINERVNEGDE